MGLELSRQITIGELFTFVMVIGSIVVAAITVKLKSNETAERTKAIDGMLEDFASKHSDLNTRLKLIEGELSDIKSRQKHYDTQIVKEIQELRVAVAKIEVKITHRSHKQNSGE
jgi:uncharacterized protein YlxW (UPF0749 family)